MKNKVEIFIICSRIFTVIVAIAENRKKKNSMKEQNLRMRFVSQARENSSGVTFPRRMVGPCWWSEKWNDGRWWTWTVWIKSHTAARYSRHPRRVKSRLRWHSWIFYGRCTRYGLRFRNLQPDRKYNSKEYKLREELSMVKKSMKVDQKFHPSSSDPNR